MNKNELIDAVASKTEGTRKDAASAVEAVFAVIKSEVAKGTKISIAGFGIFERIERSARTARNPQTGETIQVSASKAPKFRAGAEFKKTVKGM